jgi:hypothetical protein
MLFIILLCDFCVFLVYFVIQLLHKRHKEGTKRHKEMIYRLTKPALKNTILIDSH